jgi:hypothetical protein
VIESLGILFDLQTYGYGWATLVVLLAVSLTTYWLLNRSPASDWFKASEDIVPPYLALPAVLFALFSTAFATDVWQKHVQAKDAVIREAAAISSLTLLARHAGPGGTDLAQALRNYVRAVVESEWPAMTRADRTNKGSAMGQLETLDSVVLALGRDPDLPHYSALRLNDALESIRVSRMHRISLAHDPIAIAKWASPMALGVLTLLAIGIVHIRRPRAMKISLSVAVLCILATIHVLSSNRSPFMGTAATSNELLVDTLQALDRR